MTETNKSKLIAGVPRRKWTRSETRTLLVCVSNRKEEFFNPTKKRHVYNNIIEDLSSSGISETPYTVIEIKNKIKSLKMAYKTAIDNNNRTGAAPSIAPFLDLMDDIYGYENMPPEDPSTITCSVGIATQIRTLNEEEFESMIEISLPELPNEPESSSVSSPSKTLKSKPKRLSSKDKFWTKKLEFAEKKLKIQEENKWKRMREKETAKQQRHNELMLLLRKERRE